MTLLACSKQKTTEQIDSTTPEPYSLEFERIRAIHDEVMPKRGQLIRLQKQATDASQKPLADRSDYALAERRLARADSMMMTWMYADKPFDEVRASLDDAALQAYLNQREAEIRATADSMKASIAFAKITLER